MARATKLASLDSFGLVALLASDCSSCRVHPAVDARLVRAVFATPPAMASCGALFDALLMLFEVLMAVFMEKHTPKSSANSSLPASQSPNDETARTRPGAKGNGPLIQR